jgi:hypothetical protein
LHIGKFGGELLVRVIAVFGARKAQMDNRIGPAKIAPRPPPLARCGPWFSHQAR